MTKEVTVKLTLRVQEKLDETALEIAIRSMLSNENYDEIAAIFNIEIIEQI